MSTITRTPIPPVPPTPVVPTHPAAERPAAERPAPTPTMRGTNGRHSESRFQINRPSRPMLAREADAMYWMSRYVERAEHLARMTLIAQSVLADSGDLDEDIYERLWRSTLSIMRLGDLPEGVAGEGGQTDLAQRIPAYLTFSEANPNSLLNCLTRARENARGIRESISAEMFECLNSLYWSIRSEDAQARFEESYDAFFRSIMTGSMLFQGLTDQTMAHDQRWLFTQLAKYIERTDFTCRLLSERYAILASAADRMEPPIRNIHWMAVLRSCCSIEAYRRNHTGDMEPMRVAAFIVLEKNFPRSIRYGVSMAHEAISAIRGETNPRTIDPAQRILGRLDAQLEYAEVGEILTVGLIDYLQKIELDMSQVALSLQKTYFIH